jgi:hypothetical protein
MAEADGNERRTAALLQRPVRGSRASKETMREKGKRKRVAAARKVRSLGFCRGADRYLFGRRNEPRPSHHGTATC